MSQQLECAMTAFPTVAALAWAKETRRANVAGELKQVVKAWGRELWLVNNDQYCGKLLCLDKGAECSYHRHLVKHETFYALAGEAIVTIEGKQHLLAAYRRPITIEPRQLHSFYGLTDAVIMEVSTHHEDTDVERVSESMSGIVDENK